MTGPGARGEVVRAAAVGLSDAVAAEARAVGAQMRCIHRLWLTAQTARTAARFQAMAQAEIEMAAHGFVRPDPLSPLAEAEHQLLVDVAAEVGAALRIPSGTARRRVEDAVVLAEMLPEVLTALEDGRIGASQATVKVEQWRELIALAPTWTSWECVPPPVEAVCRLITELLERAPHATAAQLRAMARARRAVLVADAEERTRLTARKNRAVWVDPAADGTAYLHALLDAHVAHAVHGRSRTWPPCWARTCRRPTVPARPADHPRRDRRAPARAGPGSGARPESCVPMCWRTCCSTASCRTSRDSRAGSGHG